MARKLAMEIAHEKDIKRLDESTVEIVRGVNLLLLKAESEHLIAITNILKDARESIAWWAVHDDYTESEADMLVHHLTMDNGAHTALNFMASFTAIKDVLVRDELVQMITQFQLKDISPSKAILVA